MAASSSILQTLAKKSPQYKLALLGLALVLCGVVYYQFWYSDLSTEEENASRRKNSLLAQQRKLDKDLADQDQLLGKYEELKRSIRDNQKALPTEAELPAFYDHLQRKAGDADISISKWELMEEQPVDIYIRVPVAVEIVGSFHEIMHYFALLGPKEKDELQAAGTGDDTAGTRIDERIVTIENLELGKARMQDGEIVLDAKFVASTFRQNDTDKKPDGKDGKPAKSSAKAGVRRMTGAGLESTIDAATGGAAAGRKKAQDLAAPPGRQPSVPSSGSRSGGGSFGIRRRRRRAAAPPRRLSANTGGDWSVGDQPRGLGSVA